VQNTYPQPIKAIQRSLIEAKGDSLDKTALKDILINAFRKSYSNKNFELVVYPFLTGETELAGYLGQTVNVTNPLHFWEVAYWYIRVQEVMSQGRTLEEAMKYVREEIRRFRIFKDETAKILKVHADAGDIKLLQALRPIVADSADYDAVRLGLQQTFLGKMADVKSRATDKDCPLIPEQAVDMSSRKSWNFFNAGS
jgi:hypothetical protein